MNRYYKNKAESPDFVASQKKASNVPECPFHLDFLCPPAKRQFYM